MTTYTIQAVPGPNNCFVNRILRLTLVIILVVLLSAVASSQSAMGVSPVVMPGLNAPAEIIRDTSDIAHIRATNDHDLFYLQGWVHAQDRLFQMDFNRRAANGTLAELLGPAALSQDVSARTFGMHRAAARSMEVLSPRMAAALQAYADGVNAYVTSNPLPPEYGALGLTQFAPWTPFDTLCVSKILGYYLSFDTSDVENTVALLSYQAAGSGLGFDGLSLYTNDLFRTAPFFPVFTVPDAMAAPLVATSHAAGAQRPKLSVSSAAVELGRRYLKQQSELPKFPGLPRPHGGDSNAWAISGRYTQSGYPLLANDPHLHVTYPSTWYPIHLAAGKIDVTGGSLAGTPLVVVGHNRNVEWGFTNAPVDVTDFFQEQVVPDTSSPSGLSTMYKGSPEWIIPIPETYRANVGGALVTIPPTPENGIPPYTLIVPRRNNGPIIQLDQGTGSALSVQWTGFSGTHELDALLMWTEAGTLEEFQKGNGYFNCPPQNVSVADTSGNIGSFVVGDLPVREDLQTMTVNGLPPYFIRNGTGGNEWLPVSHPQPGQGIPYEILPASELPHIVNPPAGFFVAANNDPVGVTANNQPLSTLRAGGGIYYLGAYGFNPGFRAERIEELLRTRLTQGKVSPSDMKEIQADVKSLDAQFFVPFITRAFSNASRASASNQLTALAANPGVIEAVGRLQAWDYTTPTGLAEGFDAFDTPGQLNPRSATEIANSVAATLYFMWRSQFTNSVIDSKLAPYGLPVPNDELTLTALRNLFDNFDTTQGVGASGLDFFPLPGVNSAADRRDIYILQAMVDALNALSGPDFAKAFNGSTRQNDYRWGRLHRIVLAHPLGSIFSVPSAGGAFPPPLVDLDGIPTDGAYQTVDVANNENNGTTYEPGTSSIRAADADSFMWSHGPSERYIGEALPNGVNGVSSLPGGVSGVLGDPFYANLLPGWLVNDTYDQLFAESDVVSGAVSVSKYAPAVQ